ncbi:MAG TPA: 4'-phosphopantetheinyl transferase superfamily protein [Thermoanaerobaculia bacterium]|nr:4'-phosphopantetheinyl transferase superfamily protein [Thermoanaerobaculia bacterium]
MNLLELPPAWLSRVAVVTGYLHGDIESFFNEDEFAAVRGLRFPHQKTEWFSARMAAKWLACSRGLASDPRSVAVSGGRQRRPELRLESRAAVALSLSHTDGVGGAAIDHETIGLDVQRVRPLSERGWKFFLQEREISAVRMASIDDVAIHFWSAKEAAWKALSGENQRGLKDVGLSLSAEGSDGLRFRYHCATESGIVETRRIGSLVVALAGR